MDEAFSALDPLIRTEMQDELVNYRRNISAPLSLFPTISMKLCVLVTELPLCKMVKWLQVGTPDEILNNPANDYVRTFFRGVDISGVQCEDIARRTPNGLIRKTPASARVRH